MAKWTQTETKTKWGKALLLFDIFGFHRLWGWLSNRKKRFGPLETATNSLLVITGLVLTIFVLIFISVAFDIDITLNNWQTVKLPAVANAMGVGSFVLLIMLVLFISLKTYLRVKRRKVERETKSKLFKQPGSQKNAKKL